MAHRLCEVCKSAENPLGRLRFKKHLDGKVYCEKCLPVNPETLSPPDPVALPASSFLPAQKASAGSLVVIPCPDCRGMSHKPHGKTCESCVGYGSVRIPASSLNIYRLPGVKAPETLTEG
jgi:hypothetical protein